MLRRRGQQARRQESWTGPWRRVESVFQARPGGYDGSMPLRSPSFERPSKGPSMQGRTTYYATRRKRSSSASEHGERNSAGSIYDQRPRLITRSGDGGSITSPSKTARRGCRGCCIHRPNAARVRECRSRLGLAQRLRGRRKGYTRIEHLEEAALWFNGGRRPPI